MTTQTVDPYTVDFDVIHRFAESRNVAPQEVLKRLGIMVPIVLLGATIAIASGVYISFGAIETESAQMLAALLVAASIAVFVGGIAAIVILLWGAFVAQYVETLDAKNELFEFSQNIEFLPSIGKSEGLEIALENEVVTTTFDAPYTSETQDEIQPAIPSGMAVPPDLIQVEEISRPLDPSVYVEMVSVIDELQSQIDAYSALYKPRSRKNWWYKFYVAVKRRDVIFENIDELVSQLVISTNSRRFSSRNRQKQA